MSALFAVQSVWKLFIFVSGLMQCRIVYIVLLTGKCMHIMCCK